MIIGNWFIIQKQTLVRNRLFLFRHYCIFVWIDDKWFMISKRLITFDKSAMKNLNKRQSFDCLKWVFQLTAKFKTETLNNVKTRILFQRGYRHRLLYAYMSLYYKKRFMYIFCVKVLLYIFQRNWHYHNSLIYRVIDFSIW